MINLRKLLPLMALTLCLGILYLPGCDTLVTEVNEFTIAGHPTAEFGIDSNSVDSGCSPLTVGFIDKSSGPHDTWIWKYGDGSADTFSVWSDSTDSSGIGPVHVYTEAGTYTVSLTVIDSSPIDEPGADIETKNRFIIVGSTIDSFSVDSVEGCPGMAVTFTPINYGGISSYRWNFGDGSSTVSDSSPTHIYDSIGVFACTLTLDAACGDDVVIGFDSLITINACPVARFSSDVTEGCAPLTVTFYDETDYRGALRDTIDWRMAGDSSNIDTFEQIFETPGKYAVTLYVETDGGIDDTTEVDYITVFGPPEITFSATGSTEGCIENNWLFFVDFQATIPATADTQAYDSIVWDFGDGKRSNPSDPLPFTTKHPYDTAGLYSVTVRTWGPCYFNGDSAMENTVVDYVCASWPFDTSLAGFTVTPDADTVADIQGDTSVTFTFTDTTIGGMLGRLWDFGDGLGLNATGAEVTYQFADTGTYTVTLTVGNCCAGAEETQTIVIDTLGAFSAFRRYLDQPGKR